MSVQDVIREKLEAGLRPEHLEINNESHKHRVAPGSETHFRVVAVSAEFAGQRLLQRHRRINTLLAEELSGPVHALGLHTYTPEEWQQAEQQAPESPRCTGG